MRSCAPFRQSLWVSLTLAPIPFSNMQFTLGCIGQQQGYDAAAEIAAAAAYTLIRTMTVGETTTSYTPLTQLAVAPTLPWSVASPATIGFGNWSATSAVWRVGGVKGGVEGGVFVCSAAQCV